MFIKRLIIGTMFIFKGPIRILACLLWIFTGVQFFLGYELKIKELSKKYSEHAYGKK